MDNQDDEKASESPETFKWDDLIAHMSILTTALKVAHLATGENTLIREDANAIMLDSASIQSRSLDAYVKDLEHSKAHREAMAIEAKRQSDSLEIIATALFEMAKMKASA